MSDIYLQITETPTVVTLSAPVISGALSSTVTVANTVTVALDANSLSALENVTVTVGAAVTISNFPATQAVSLASVPTHGVTLASTTVTVSSLPAISGTVTANVFGKNGNGAIIPLQMAYSEETFANGNRLAVSIVNSEGYEYTTPLPISVNGVPNDNGIPYFGVGYFTSPGSSLIQVSQDPNCGLPINGTVTANTFAVQGTAVTTSNFTSTAPSTVLANFNAGREVLTIFNEGAGNLHICAGATCTTIAYQVRLSAGDYYEVPNHQTTITHSAVFATAGTARVCQVS
jgi:hypothetical protein